MFYSHWKKLALALTAFFWSSCTSENSTQPMYGVIDPSDNKSSSSETSSSSAEESSSSNIPLSAPLYGVFQMDCDVVNMHDSTLTCANGYTCTVKTDTIHIPAPECSENFDGTGICPAYGVAMDVISKKYECDDGITYSEQNFNIRNASSSSAEGSSSSTGVSCFPDPSSFFYKNRSEKYTESQAISNATDQAKWDASNKIGDIIRDSESKSIPKCLTDIQDTLERSFVALYGAPGTPIPTQYRCSDGTAILTEEYLEQKAFDEEQAKKKPQYDEKYAEVYKEETEKFDKEINDCLNSEKTEE